jgi:DNA-binding transcriptional LysR family regulator
MHKTLRRLPSLDFLRGFEASGRLKSFTRAADELHLTQSALSRQVAAIEEALGVALFERRHRALSFTPEGEAFHREITTHLQAIARAAESAVGARRAPGLTVTTTVSFASLWLIPRLARFRAKRPDAEVYVSADDRTVDLARGEVDVAIRYVGQDSKLPAGALAMKYRTKPKNITMNTSTLQRVWLIHCEVARTGPVTLSAGVLPPGPTVVIR